MDPKTIGTLAALGSALSWALGAVLFKKLGDQLSSPAMTLVKSLISAALLGLVLVFIGFKSVSNTSLGLLILSGILAAELDAVGSAFSAELTQVDLAAENEWRALRFTRPEVRSL